MKNRLLTILLIISLVLLLPLDANALSKNYKDKLASLTQTEVKEGEINLYFFHGEECPHCAKERELLKEIENEYDNVNIIMFEVWHNEDNSKLLKDVKKVFKITNNNVPFTVIGTKTFTGYSDITKKKIYETIDKYEGNNKSKNKYTLPILGNVNVKNISIPLIAIILGLIDGFNPCAMWVLLFLLNILINQKDIKRMYILGNIFLLTSGLIYFLSMLGLSLVLDISTVVWIRNIIAVVAVVIGILNLNTYRKTRNEAGCHVVKDDKRKNLLTKMKEYTSRSSLILAIIGIITLAVSVNLVELACSLGFPAVFSEILAINKVTGLNRILYLILYDIFYMLDDMIVFYIALFTFNIKAISNKYSKYSNLIGGIIILLIGLLLLLKPEWIMFNFS